jgi:hypothetical protein
MFKVFQITKKTRYKLPTFIKVIYHRRSTPPSLVGIDDLLHRSHLDTSCDPLVAPHVGPGATLANTKTSTCLLSHCRGRQPLLQHRLDQLLKVIWKYDCGGDMLNNLGWRLPAHWQGDLDDASDILGGSDFSLGIVCQRREARMKWIMDHTVIW